ncbi:MAG: monovalent cation/H+ antiporter subunit D family protein [Deltaproteobacteria bacterium]|nr:monovalent cation/H+ antiporter subunit D family protein [Deltaproteobacteria bacterium]
MSQHFPALIIIVPLLAAFFIFTASWINRKLCFPIAVLALAIALVSTMGLLGMVLNNGPVEYRMGGWPPPWGIPYYVDYLNALVLVVIYTVALINLLACRQSIWQEFSDKIGSFLTLYVLFVTGLGGMVVTGDAFNLYVLLEIASLTGYALIGMGKGDAALSGLNYIFMGTIGASFYLLGIGYLYLVTGSLNIADIASILPGVYGSKVVLVAFIFCMTGLFLKMAFFPLHGWLPNAYTNAPSAAISLIAPLTTKVMIYVMIRIVLYLFTPSFSFEALHVGSLLVWLSAVAIVMGSLLALSQKSLKRMLAYIIVAEVGYMTGGLWLGNTESIIGAILHLVNDAAMTLCVFLAAGTLMFKIKPSVAGELQLDDLAGSFTKMPYTMAAFVMGALSIIGVPPFCGFFSKWYLLSGAVTAGHYEFLAALLFSSLVNVVLFFRIIEIGYYGKPGHRAESGHSIAHMDEAPLEMLIPLLLVAAGLLVMGIYTDDIVTHVIRFAIPAGIV